MFALATNSTTDMRTNTILAGARGEGTPAAPFCDSDSPLLFRTTRIQTPLYAVDAGESPPQGQRPLASNDKGTANPMAETAQCRLRYAGLSLLRKPCMVVFPLFPLTTTQQVTSTKDSPMSSCAAAFNVRTNITPKDGNEHTHTHVHTDSGILTYICIHIYICTYCHSPARELCTNAR